MDEFDTKNQSGQLDAANPEKRPVVVSMHEAKSNLSKLVKRAAGGETIYIGAYGIPEAMLVGIPGDRPAT